MIIETTLSQESVHEKLSKGVPENFRVPYNERGRFANRAPWQRQPLVLDEPPASTASAGCWRRRRPQAKEEAQAAKAQLRPVSARAGGPSGSSAPREPPTPPPHAHAEQEQ